LIGDGSACAPRVGRPPLRASPDARRHPFRASDRMRADQIRQGAGIMNKYVSRGLWTVLVTGGFMALGVGVAHADTGTTGEDGIASGTQGILGIELPVQLGGNAISLLGDAHSSGATTSAPATAAPADASGGTSGSDSVAGGTQLLPELGVPITLGGNSISVFGDASSTAAETTPATVPAEGSA